MVYGRVKIGTPLVVLLGLGEPPLVGVRMMMLKALSGPAVLHDQFLSQRPQQSAVLSVVLDCPVSCPWQGLVVSDTQNKKCWS